MATRRTGRAKTAHGAKAEFVRAHPGVPASELVALAKKDGVVMTPGHIYNIRAQDKKRAENGGATAVTNGAERPNGRARNERTAATTTGGSEESQLRALVLRIGLDRAEAVMGRLRDQLKDLE